MILFSKKLKISYFLVLGLMFLINSISFAKESSGDVYESRLMTIVSNVEQGQLDQALKMVDDLLLEYPKSRIGA